MARIKIEDLPRNRKITKEEMQRITGGSLQGAMDGIRDVYDGFSNMLKMANQMQMAVIRNLGGSGGGSSDDDTSDGSSSGFKPSLDTYESSGR